MKHATLVTQLKTFQSYIYIIHNGRLDNRSNNEKSGVLHFYSVAIANLSCAVLSILNMATCRGCLSAVCARCDLSPSMCDLTECGRCIIVRTAGLHCRLCFTTIEEDVDHDHTSDEEDYYESASDTDEGFWEEEQYYPEVQPRIVSFSIYYYFFYFFFQQNVLFI